MAQPLTDERRKADQIKTHEPILVVLGNPPYHRLPADYPEGWVGGTLMKTFKDPIRTEYSGDFKNLKELSIWFYRWALWKLFEAEGAPKHGVLTFITNRKWLTGGAFGGMRQVFRRKFDSIFIIDLHGDSRAALPAHVDVDENIFSIRLGVAIAICIADGTRSGDEAQVHYVSSWGTRNQKLDWLDSISADLSNSGINALTGTGTDVFLPGLDDIFESLPRLRDDVFVFGHSGVETKRDALVVAPTRDQLRVQIVALLEASSGRQPELFHETGARTIERLAEHQFRPGEVREYGYRPLDKEYLYNHEDFIDRRRPSLQTFWGDDNMCLFTLPEGHGAGPSVFLQTSLPDRHAYRGSYGGYAFPLWDRRHSAHGQFSINDELTSNFNHRLLRGLERWFGRSPDPRHLFAYIYAALSAPAYSLEFSRDLQQSFPRVPFPRDVRLFEEGVALGSRLLALHSLDEKRPNTSNLTVVGNLEFIDTLQYELPEGGDGRIMLSQAAWIEPVPHDVWTYSVSGYDVVRQWLERRRGVRFDVQRRAEALDVVWAVEETIKLSEHLDDLLTQVLETGALTTDDIGI